VPCSATLGIGRGEDRFIAGGWNLPFADRLSTQCFPDIEAGPRGPSSTCSSEIHLVAVLPPLVVLLVQLLQWLDVSLYSLEMRYHHAVHGDRGRRVASRPICDDWVRTFGRLTLGTTTVLIALGASLGSADLSPPG
jgi:hypothetical protein